MSNKKRSLRSSSRGFTLIEVVVALGILAMAFAGVVTLIVVALNLSTNSRNTTEATALMQRGLADASAAVKSCCNTGTTTLSGYTVGSPNQYSLTTSGATSLTLTVTLDTTAAANLADNSSTYTLANSAGNSRVVMVTSTVNWNYRGSNYSISSTQYVGTKS